MHSSPKSQSWLLDRSPRHIMSPLLTYIQWLLIPWQVKDRSLALAFPFTSWPPWTFATLASTQERLLTTWLTPQYLPLTVLPVTSFPIYVCWNVLYHAKLNLKCYRFEESSLDRVYLLINSYCTPYLSRNSVSHSSYRGTWVPTCLCREITFSPLSPTKESLFWLSLLSGSFIEGRSSSLSVQSQRHCLGHVFHVEGHSISSLATYSVFPSSTSWTQAFYYFLSQCRMLTQRDLEVF